MTAVARGVMAVARRCLGSERETWGCAMQAEFEAALDDGRPLAFAFGCLLTAFREMIRGDEGRLVVARYTLALALVVPVAAGQFEDTLRLVMAPVDHLADVDRMIGMVRNPYLILPQNSAIPVLLLLNLLLGAGHLRLAWTLTDGDWLNVTKTVALIGAATVTLGVFTSILMLGGWWPTSVAALMVESIAILLAARCQARFARQA